MKSKSQSRVIIEQVQPAINCGQHAISRVVGQRVVITADVYADGHDIVQATIQYKTKKAKKWQESRMEPTGNDAWSGQFICTDQIDYHYRVQAWVDYALNWQHGIARKIEDGQHVASELLDGIQYLDYLEKVTKEEENAFVHYARSVFDEADQYEEAIKIAQSNTLTTLFKLYPKKDFAVHSPSFDVTVDREKALFSTWYEFFPRSASEQEGLHGSFKDCERLLPRIADMGFDILYFPPIHPIGEINRKGKNNATHAQEGDAGSPWAIGSQFGGHKAIHPELGDLKDFKSLIKSAQALGIEIAMDFALQAAPDHPYVKKHPQWFRWRPDGTVQYAENPPKKYQDILPIYFESEDYKNLWDELLSIALYWVDQGIRVFRVDNPHTKPFGFWGWLIRKVREQNADVIFLSEAFTRPKVMQQLAKQGFTQSYTYFTWRNNKYEIQQYISELTQGEQREYFRPNFWPNTPDINPFELQSGLESTHLFRLFLAATLSSNYGLYGPVYEYRASEAIANKEEYLDSEKYQVRHWQWTEDNTLRQQITKINQIRKEQAALQQTNNILFLETENDQLIAYLKWNEDYDNFILCVVNLDPFENQIGAVHVPRDLFGLEDNRRLEMYDLITDNSYDWHDFKNYVSLSPELPYHLFKVSW